MPKLTKDKAVKVIQELMNERYTLKDISKKLNVSYGTVARVKRIYNLLYHLVCPRCGKMYSSKRITKFCPDCYIIHRKNTNRLRARKVRELRAKGEYFPKLIDHKPEWTKWKIYDLCTDDFMEYSLKSFADVYGFKLEEVEQKLKKLKISGIYEKQIQKFRRIKPALYHKAVREKRIKIA